MHEKMTLSYVVPAYQASETIGAALRSVFEPSVSFPNSWQIEVLVVDDGSPDRQALHKVLKNFPRVRLHTHEANRGMVASRNTGIMASGGDIVTILDADDKLVPDWPDVLCQILSNWPSDVNVCFSACRTPDGRSTVSEPDFMGLLTVDDKLNELRSGEYLPLFRGLYIRSHGYVDLGMHRDCGIVSYLTFLQDCPAWVTPQVLRIYYPSASWSMSNWTSASNARYMARCCEALFERFGKLYATRAPRTYRTKLLRYAVYLKLAGEAGAWRVWARAAHWYCLPDTLGALLMLLLGKSFTSCVVDHAKKFGLIKRFG